MFRVRKDLVNKSMRTPDMLCSSMAQRSSAAAATATLPSFENWGSGGIRGQCLFESGFTRAGVISRWRTEKRRGGKRREGQTEENDTDLCRGHVPSPFVRRVGMTPKMDNLSLVHSY